MQDNGLRLMGFPEVIRLDELKPGKSESRARRHIELVERIYDAFLDGSLRLEQ